MSHIEKNETVLKNEVAIKKALEKLGMMFIKQDGVNQSLKIYDGSTAKADIKISEHLGLNKTANGTYEVVGDFWYLKGYKGYGEENPIALNKKANGTWFKESQKYNRRVEFIVVNQGKVVLKLKQFNVPAEFKDKDYIENKIIIK